jgi:hypothetical protein
MREREEKHALAEPGKLKIVCLWFFGMDVDDWACSGCGGEQEAGIGWMAGRI